MITAREAIELSGTNADLYIHIKTAVTRIEKVIIDEAKIGIKKFISIPMLYPWGLNKHRYEDYVAGIIKQIEDAEFLVTRRDDIIDISWEGF